MKYKLINSVTKKETICDKVTIDGFDYYVSDEKSQIGDSILWEKQTYHGSKEYANYIGKVYILKECFPNGKEIVLENFFPKKPLDEVRQSIITFLEKVGKQRTVEQIEESAIRNQSTSGNLYLKIGYNISENDIKKAIATNNPNIDIPKVVDIKLLKYKIAEHEYPTGKRERKHTEQEAFINGWRQCLQSQEAHSNSDEDMIEFTEWLVKRLEPKYDCDTTMNFIPQVMIHGEEQVWTKGNELITRFYTTKELLQIWKEQQPKVVYYEN